VILGKEAAINLRYAPGAMRQDVAWQVNSALVLLYWRVGQRIRKERGKNIKYLPYAFTEHGAIMAANVLNSSQAVRMSVDPRDTI
jgi:hypothetical protein